MELFEGMRRCLLVNNVGTSTARLNSVRSLTYTAYSDFKFPE